MKSRKEILLELTPLLDVILIMMFYILMQNTLASKQEQDNAKAEAEQIVQSAEAQSEAYEETIAQLKESYVAEMEDAKAKESSAIEALEVANIKLAGGEAFNEYAIIVGITVVNGESGQRKLIVVSGDDEHIISYDWDNMKYAENALENELKKYIELSSDERPLFVVFGYEDAEIYRRDYELVSEVTTKAASSKEHIYLRYSQGGKKNE